MQHYGPSPLGTANFAPGGVGPLTSPTTMYFATASAAAQTLTVTGSTGPYTINGCGGIVNVTGSSPTFTITPIGSTTSPTAPTYLSNYSPCQLSVTDSASNVTPVSVIVGL